MQGVKGYLAPAVGQSLGVVASLAVKLDEAVEYRAKSLAQFFRLKELPLIKVKAVGQGETGEKIISIQVDGFGQIVDAIRLILLTISRLYA